LQLGGDIILEHLHMTCTFLDTPSYALYSLSYFLENLLFRAASAGFRGTIFAARGGA
jgi:hypothetical protein